MPDPHPRPPTATARPLLRTADYAARGRRQVERKAAEYRRARARRAEAGDVELWAWVSAQHAGRIREVVAVCCRRMQAEDETVVILGWEPAPAASGDPAGLSGGAAPSEGRQGPPDAGAGGDGGYHDRGSDPGPDPDDPALWRGAGLSDRRRAQARRARARKKAMGLIRIRLVVPADLKPEVAVLLDEIGDGIGAGLLPVIENVPPGEGPTEEKPPVNQTETRSSNPSPLPRPDGPPPEERPAIPKAVSQDALGGTHPARPGAAADSGQRRADNAPCPARSASDPLPGHLGAGPAAADEEGSPLFDDIQALARWPGIFNAGPDQAPG